MELSGSKCNEHFSTILKSKHLEDVYQKFSNLFTCENHTRINLIKLCKEKALKNVIDLSQAGKFFKFYKSRLNSYVIENKFAKTLIILSVNKLFESNYQAKLNFYAFNFH